MITDLHLTPHGYAACVQHARKPALIRLPYDADRIAGIRKVYSDFAGRSYTRVWSAYARSGLAPHLRPVSWRSIANASLAAFGLLNLSAPLVLPARLRALSELMREEAARIGKECK
jgi:hypothetical protein